MSRGLRPLRESVRLGLFVLAAVMVGIGLAVLRLAAGLHAVDGASASQHDERRHRDGGEEAVAARLAEETAKR